MVREIKKKRVDKSFNKFITSSEYIPNGTLIELIHNDVVIITLDIIGKTLTVYKKELVDVLCCDIKDEFIIFIINEQINSSFNFLFNIIIK